MIIKNIDIKKFRGFADVQFDLGEQITVIAGQNGTQKTTLLGMLTQPFTITDKENPLYGERPLCGGSYKSLFSEKFKLSSKFDLPKSHEWTLNLNDDNKDLNFTVESISRSKNKKENFVRFWKKGDRSKGSGYIQHPVIYLSLSRLFPIGEDAEIDSSENIRLSEKEFKFYEHWHNKILIMPVNEMSSVDYLESKQKNTLGVNTSFYDWKMNSAGQDNIGKILLAILSFKRLKNEYKEHYKGGILAVDELDATLYPASQLELLKALRKFSSELNIQIVFTTHSLVILEKACELQEDMKINGQIKVAYLKKVDNNIKTINGISFGDIESQLNVALSPAKKTRKINVFTEDAEARIFLRAILKSKASTLEFIDCTLGSDNLIHLAQKKIKGFRSNESLIFLDGDVKTDKSKMKKIGKLKNFLVLPGKESVERSLAKFLYNLPDESSIWDKITLSYSKQFTFKNFSLLEINDDRVKAKKWFNEQKAYWGQNGVRLINHWIKNNCEEVNQFVDDYQKLRKNYK